LAEEAGRAPPVSRLAPERPAPEGGISARSLGLRRRGICRRSGRRRGWGRGRSHKFTGAHIGQLTQDLLDRRTLLLHPCRNGRFLERAKPRQDVAGMEQHVDGRRFQREDAFLGRDQAILHRMRELHGHVETYNPRGSL
jgi:hypothetical protein